MPKMKTKKAVAKRFKITSLGKWIHNGAFTSHLAHSKSKKQKRQLRGWRSVSDSDYKRLKNLFKRR